MYKEKIKDTTMLNVYDMCYLESMRSSVESHQGGRELLSRIVFAGCRVMNSVAL